VWDRMPARWAVCVPSVYLAQCQVLAGWAVVIELGAQDVSAMRAGPTTGEIAAAMLKEFGGALCDRRALGAPAVPWVKPMNWVGSQSTSAPSAAASRRSCAWVKRWQSARAGQD